ncbi:MAG: c-type cytochrome [Gemmatimonadales bacterium]
MNATARVGILLLLAACGGRGDGGGAVDTTASLPAADQAAGSAGMADMASDTAMAADTAIAKAASAPGDTAPAQTGSAAPAPKPAAPKPATEPAATKPAAEPAAPGAQQIALGDSIFHGQVAGGTCTACHGQDAKGTAVAPNLTDKEWINGDGSLAFIEKTVTNGVAQPKQHPAPMPPKGGAALDDQQVKAVAAYVFSLSH